MNKTLTNNNLMALPLQKKVAHSLLLTPPKALTAMLLAYANANVFN